MKQIRLLYDVGLLATVPSERRSGLCRMTEAVLQQLVQYPHLTVYPCLWTKDKFLLQRLDELGLSSLKERVIRLPLLRYHTDDADWKRRLKGRLFSVLGKRKYASTLSQFDGLFGSYLRIPDAIYQSDLPVFSYVHDMIPIVHPEYSDSKFSEAYRQWMQANQSDFLLFNSENSRKDFLKFRPDYPLEKTRVIYLGVDDRFQPDISQTKIQKLRRQYGISDKRYFLALSAESTRKNFTHLIEAFRQFLIRTQCQDIVLVIGGPKTKSLDSFLNQYPELRKQFVLTGFINDTDLPALYAGSEAFIYPSLYEGFGLPPLEAMACGTPVICCDNSSLPEVCGNAVVFIDGVTIFQTVSALEKVYQDSQFRQKLHQQGLIQAQKFSWEKTGEQICSCIINNLKKGKKNDSKNSYDYGYYRSGRRISG